MIAPMVLFRFKLIQDMRDYLSNPVNQPSFAVFKYTNPYFTTENIFALYDYFPQAIESGTILFEYVKASRVTGQLLKEELFVNKLNNVALQLTRIYQLEGMASPKIKKATDYWDNAYNTFGKMNTLGWISDLTKLPPAPTSRNARRI